MSNDLLHCGPHAANNKLFHTQSTKDGSRDSEVRKIKMQLYTPFGTSVVNLRTFFSALYKVALALQRYFQ